MDVQAEREELRDTTEDHDHGDHEVDDTAAVGGKGDGLAGGASLIDSREDSEGGRAAWLSDGKRAQAFPPAHA